MTKILVIKLSAMGDVFATTANFSQLRKHCDELIHLVSKSSAAVTMGNPHLDKTLVIDDLPSGSRWHDLMTSIQLAKLLLLGRYDYVFFVPHKNLILGLVCRIFSTGKIIGLFKDTNYLRVYSTITL